MTSHSYRSPEDARLIRDLEQKVLDERADNTRLRGLVKTAEWKGETWDRPGWVACAWCEARYDHGGGSDIAKHDADCPAFTPDGEVR